MEGNHWEPQTVEVARLRDRMLAWQTMTITRIEALEEEWRKRWAQEETAATQHRTRVWQVTLAVLTGFVLPLVVIGVLAALHLSGK